MFKKHLIEYRCELKKEIDNISIVEFNKIMEILKTAYKKDKQVFIVGNGGSAGTANHFVCDFGKNAVLDPSKKRFRAISLSDNVEKITAFGNDIAFEEIFRQQMINLLNPEDVVIIISASGSSSNIVRACEYAKERNAKVITFSGFGGGKIANFANAAIITEIESYEQIEDLHLIVLHMIVSGFKDNPEYLL